MIIDTKPGIADSFLPSGSFDRKLKSSNDLFTKHLESQMGKSAEKTDEQANKRTNIFADDIDNIKEKGLINYFNELESKKREELRAEILEGMGLAEEDLGEMSPEQRALIEKIVTGEIQKLIAASSLLNNNDTEADQPVPEHIMHRIRAEFAFLPTIDEKGKTDLFTMQKEEDR